MNKIIILILTLTPLWLSAQNTLFLHQENTSTTNLLSHIQRITFDDKGNMTFKLKSNENYESFKVEEIDFLSFEYQNWNSISEKAIASENSSLNIFPNPVENIINFKSDINAITNVNLFNSQGEIVRKYRIINGLQSYDVSDLHAGLYLCQIDNIKMRITKVFIKK